MKTVVCSFRIDEETCLNWLGLLAIPALVALNGFFVAAEFALVAVRKTRVEELVNQGVRGASAVSSAVEHLDRTIAATQLGITLASLALGWVGEPALAHLIEPLFGFVPVQWVGITTHSFAVIITFVMITFMHVVFGELMPKTLALQIPDRTALWVAPPLNVFARAMYPVIRTMNGIGNWLIRRMGFRAAGEEGAIHSVQELQMIIEDTQEAGLLESDQSIYLQNIFGLTDKTVQECMIPRDKMDAIELSTPSEKVLEIVRDSGHTRLPVYEGEVNNIVGILNTKNLFYFFSLQNAIVLEDALYPATFLTPDESIANALRLFRKSHRPMAMVRERTGEILGLITLENILEEIVGELEDEHDAPVPKAKKIRKPGKR